VFRLFGVVGKYVVCPIVFNVHERLPKKFRWRGDPDQKNAPRKSEKFLNGTIKKTGVHDFFLRRDFSPHEARTPKTFSADHKFAEKFFPFQPSPILLWRG